MGPKSKKKSFNSSKSKPKNTKGASKVKVAKSLQNVYEYDSDSASNPSQHLDMDFDPENLDGLARYDTVKFEDDEDIDSDEAFDSSDDERFGDFKFGSQRSSSLKPLKNTSSRNNKSIQSKNADSFDSDQDSAPVSDEGSELGSDLDESSGTFLSDLLGPVDTSETPIKPSSRKRISAQDLLGLSSKNDMDNNFSYSEDEDIPQHKRQKTQPNDSISDQSEDSDIDFRNFENKKKHDALLASLGVSDRSKKQTHTAEKTELIPESELSLGSISSNKNAKLGLGDFISSIKGKSNLDSFKSSLEKVQKNISKSDESSITLKAPLPKRIQEKFDREAAYSISKDAVSAWQPIVNANREARHLTFPTNAPVVDKKKGAFITSNFIATKGLEQEIESILQISGVDETNIRNSEELELQNENKELALAKKSELRAIRELMFRKEQKARRLAKIKSKTYRRILKKEKLKKLAQLKQDQIENGEYNSDDLEEETTRERQRAQERMTLKHKSGSNWAKEMKRFGKHNDQIHESLNDQLNKHEELLKKISMASDDESTKYNSSDSDIDQDEQSDKYIKSRAITQINELMDENDDQNDLLLDQNLSQSKKTLFSMKFMQTGMQKRKEEINKAALELQKELGLNETTQDTNLIDQSGRKTFRPSKLDVQSKPSPASAKNSDKHQNVKQNNINNNPEKPKTISEKSNKTTNKSKDNFSSTTHTPSNISELIMEESSVQQNPWIESTSDKILVSKQTHDFALTDRSKKRDKASSKLRKDKTKAILNSNKALSETNDSSFTLINPDSANSILSTNEKTNKKTDSNVSSVSVKSADAKTSKDKPLSSKKTKKNSRKPANVTSGDSKDLSGHKGPELSGSDSEENDSEYVFNQKELVERAFAMDAGLIEKKDFDEEVKLMEEENRGSLNDKSNGILPGWGTWSGSAPKNQTKKLVYEGGKPAKDKKYYEIRKLENVVINQKKHKKNLKYTSESLPFPYNQASHYNINMSAPVGPEWNTASAVRKLVKPRVITKMGKIIQPLSKNE
ncbi:hypothetical protein BB560_004507 [Smittium megazygosporum]|uniref:Uncharacterized protein n=1 Tax=Smittium megazygosporum TaxID=133381 RepID=A0A2T9Z911_9FUNG|nr:hypothetical protein BB560_004507 [Smittium megazygosporum]